jgi:sterol desaturase/sphingolipid hydroxylase (fatty acid hydroxylase superfamily)
MMAFTTLLRYGTFPLFVLGFNAALIDRIGAGAPYWQPLALLLGAVLVMFAIERLLPYQPDWNRPSGDALRDVLHAGINTAFNHLGVLSLPLLAGLGWFRGWWPGQWPFWLQVVGALLVVDFGISAAHHASHRWPWLWRFHAVHHSVRRLYGFNGLMKHPLHQLVETVSGVLPLLLLGIPQPVALAVAFCVAIQLLLQHSNADYRSGPLKYLFANAEIHRFHHVNQAGEGDVNFGLFTTLWDHLAGTFHYQAGQAPRTSAEVGLAEGEAYPDAYAAQLLRPFRNTA